MKRKAKTLRVSDHAIVRYLQRVEGMDLSPIYDRILTERLLEQHATLGSGIYPVDHFIVRIRDNTVITILK